MKSELSGLQKAQESYVPKEQLEKVNESENYLIIRMSQLDHELKQQVAQNEALKRQIDDINEGRVIIKQVQGNSSLKNLFTP